MKNKILAFVLLLSSIVIADMIYDPVKNLIYSSNSKINQDEYRSLVLCCLQLEHKLHCEGIFGQKNYDQLLDMLKRINTSASTQLIKDLKKKKIFFPNGSVYNDLII